MASPIFSMLMDIRRGLRASGGLDVRTYCDLIGVASETTLVCTDGSLVSMINLRGSKRLVGDEETESLVRLIRNGLSSALKRRGHIVEFVFNQEPGWEAEGEGELANAIRDMRHGARASGCALDDVLDEVAATYSDRIWNESTHLVIWTKPEALSPTQLKLARQETSKKAKKNPPMDSSVQQRHGVLEDLVYPHESFVKAVLELFTADKSVGYVANVLSTAEFMREVRRQIDPELTAADWTPRIDGAPITLRIPEQSGIDPASFLQPSLADQLFPRPSVLFNLEEATIGNRTYAPVVISQPPVIPQPFNLLLRQMRREKVPFRMKFQISGGGLDLMGIKKDAAGILARFGASNMQAAKAFNLLKRRAQQGESIVGFRMDACTWARKGNTKDLRRRAAILGRAIQGWGQCDTDTASGNPISGLLSSVGGYTSSSVSPLACAPLEDLVPLLPLSRPVSPFGGGQYPLMTPDGRLFPMTAASSVQTVWATGIVGPPGFGKSVRLQLMNFSLVVNKNAEGLPCIRGLDIGYSQTGFCSLVRTALPPSMRHLVIHRRMRNLATDCINPCETPLGFRTPTADHAQWLLAFLMLAIRPADRNAPTVDVKGCLNQAVDFVYKQYSDDPSMAAKRYARARSKLIDNAIDRSDLVVTPETTWWDIEDYFLEQNNIRMAQAAHRFAVPTLQDLMGACKHNSISTLYAMQVPGTGRSVADFCWMKLMELSTEYPIMSGDTQLELGEARIVILDLEDIAPEGNDEASKRSALMFSLCARAITSDIFLHIDDIKDKLVELAAPLGSGLVIQERSHAMMENLRNYLIGRAQVLGRSIKRLMMDEFKRAARTPGIADMAERWIREGRKNRVEEIFASQLPGDFPKDMRTLFSTLVILGKGDAPLTEFADMFELSETAQAIVRDRLTGPGPDGASSLERFSTKDGQFQFQLNTFLGPTLRWASSTTKEDAMLRDTLYEQFEPDVVRKALASRFPSGSAEREIERRMEQMRSSVSGLTEDKMKAIIVRDLLEELGKDITAVVKGAFLAGARVAA